MSQRLEYDAVCPNNHNLRVAFTKDEFEDALKSETLVYHCNTCDTSWAPSGEEIAKIRKEFAKMENQEPS